MPSREQLAAAVRAGDSYEDVGARFGIPPGQAYLIVTGLPADGSDVLGPELLAAKRDYLLDGSSQHLANPPTEAPTEDDDVLQWIKRRAAADEPMRQAARERTAEPPAVEGDSDDVLDVLGYDHNQVKYLQEQLEAIPGVTKGGSEVHQQRRVSIVDMIRVRLARHETVEEAYFWPAVRDGVPGGAELAEQALEQEQHGKELLQALMGMAGGDEKFDELVEELSDALRKHVAFEDMVFLKVREHVAEQDRVTLGRKIKRAKPGAPTRPHPHAPAGSKLAAAAAAPLDKARDALGDRPANRNGQAESGESQAEEETQ